MTSAKPKPPLIPGETRAYPVLPLRDIVVFPHMIVPLFVGREKSIKAMSRAKKIAMVKSVNPTWTDLLPPLS